MKILFSNNHQAVLAKEIIRCRTSHGDVFHVGFDWHGDVNVYAPGTQLICYEVDNKRLTEEEINGKRREDIRNDGEGCTKADTQRPNKSTGNPICSKIMERVDKGDAGWSLREGEGNPHPHTSPSGQGDPAKLDK